MMIWRHLSDKRNNSKHCGNCFKMIYVSFMRSPEGVLLKKVLLKVLQNSQENTCARVSFLKKIDYCEIFGYIFFIEHLRWLLLYNQLSQKMKDK